MVEKAHGNFRKYHMRMIWHSLRFQHLGLAFFLACVMLTFRSSVLLCSCLDTKVHAEITLYVGLAAQATILLTFALFIYFRPTLAKRLPGSAFIACLVIGLLILSIGGHGNIDLAVLTSVVGSLCCGIGYGYLCGMWAHTYGCMHPARTSFYVPLSSVFALVLFFVVFVLSELSGIQATLFVIPMPIISFLSLRKCRHEYDAPAPVTTSPHDYLQAFRSLMTLFLGAALFAFILGVSWQLSASSSETINETHFVPLLISLGISMMYLALVVFFRRRINMSIVYRVAMPIFMLVFALMPLLYDTNPDVLFAAANAAYVLFDIVIWTMVTERAYDYRVSGFVLGGAARGLALVSRLAGIFVGGLLVSSSQASWFFVMALSGASLYFSIMWVVALVIRRKSPDQTGTLEQSSGEEVGNREAGDLGDTGSLQESAHHTEPHDLLSAKCAYVVETYRLTRRESEVLPYLAQGRSAKYIAEALFVSENTVRSHISNIMTKVGIRSKEKIIDIVNNALEENIAVTV